MNRRLRFFIYLLAIIAIIAVFVWFVPHAAYGVMGLFYIWQVAAVTYAQKELQQKGRAMKIALNTGVPYKTALLMVQALDLLREGKR